MDICDRSMNNDDDYHGRNFGYGNVRCLIRI